MTINIGDYIRDKDFPLGCIGGMGRVVSRATHKLGPVFIIELANGERSLIFEDNAVLLGYVDARPVM